MKLAFAFAMSACLGLATGVSAQQPAAATPATVVSTTGAAAPAKAALTLADSAVIGASVSAGCEVSLPGFPPAVIDGHCNLADVLGAMLGGTALVSDEANPKKTRLNAIAPTSFASLNFFMSPDQMADSQIGNVKKLARTPKLVFAIDFLFWHAYGSGMNDDDRRKLFDKGLERLASLPHETTVVLADLPDMTHAVGLMLSKDMVPSVTLQEELNKKLKDWAGQKQHDNVLLFSLREVVANSWAGKPITLGGKNYDGEAARGLLTNSGLHATCAGMIAVAEETMRQLKQRNAIAKDAVWETDPAVIMQRLVDAKKARDEAKKAAATSPAPAPKPEPVPAK